MGLEQLSSNATFGGKLIKYKHAASSSLGGLPAQFNVFLPRQATGDSKVPVLYYLAGLTCNEDTAAWKGGFIRDAAEHGIALVFPDTSPRGANIKGEEDDWDFGTGAGFYINATSDEYKKHYNMASSRSSHTYDFVVKELPSLLSELPIDTSNASIMGHSMGGHGALTIYLRNLASFKSASAFAPISNPTEAPWGHKAFKGYLERGIEEGKQYDATELLKNTDKSENVNILVDVGTGDQFYQQKQLLPENLIKARDAQGFSQSQVQVNLHDDYDHSYYFISTFAPDHVKFHAEHLKAHNATLANDDYDKNRTDQTNWTPRIVIAVVLIILVMLVVLAIVSGNAFGLIKDSERDQVEKQDETTSGLDLQDEMHETSVTGASAVALTEIADTSSMQARVEKSIERLPSTSIPLPSAESISSNHPAESSDSTNKQEQKSNLAILDELGITEFKPGRNKGIGSWFETNNGRDFTNGNSWCGCPYDDTLPLFAPPVKRMLSNFNNDYERAAKAYCGLEAKFYVSPQGHIDDKNNKGSERTKEVLLWIGDGFAQEWVKSEGSVDIVKQSFQKMFGKKTEDKNDVILDLEWELTGNRNDQYTFEVCR
ncbi:hypothetical protein OIO90_004245 [Microbotryomycetes sp. JL221]|nr:hypothetical protein OIO90_004245 [Microbotryomycetes sp. JL221]